MPSRRRAPWWAWVVAALVLAALVAWPLGGWDTVERDAAQAERIAPGERHDAEQFATRIDRAEVLDVRPGSSLDPEPGVAYLAVYGTFENRTDQTYAAASDLLSVRVGDRTLERADSQVLVADGSSSTQLQPGLPTEVAYVWEVDASAVAPGDGLQVSVIDRTSEESLITSGTTWLFPRVGAVVDLVAS